MKLKSLITETIVNLFSEKDKEKYADQVWDILQKSYASIGGIKGNGFKDKDDMIKNIHMWKLFKRGPDVKAVIMYKDKSGRKKVAIGTDKSDDAKTMLANMIKDEYTLGRSYGEISGKALSFTIKILGKEFLQKIAIPVENVKKILIDDEIVAIDKFNYKRKIGGSWHEKIMLGNPNAKFY